MSGQSTREIMLKIQAAMPNGSWPIEKTFSFQIVTNNTNSDIVGCSSVPGQPLPDIPTPNGRFPASFMCNDISAGGLKWSIGFHFHAVEYRADRTIKSIRYRDGTGGRYMDFNSNGSFQDTDTNSSCRNKSISQLTQEVTPPP